MAGDVNPAIWQKSLIAFLDTTHKPPKRDIIEDNIITFASQREKHKLGRIMYINVPLASRIVCK